MTEKRYPPTLAGTIALYCDRADECIKSIKDIDIDDDGDMDTDAQRLALIHAANATNWLDGIGYLVRREQIKAPDNKGAGSWLTNS